MLHLALSVGITFELYSISGLHFRGSIVFSVRSPALFIFLYRPEEQEYEDCEEESERAAHGAGDGAEVLLQVHQDHGVGGRAGALKGRPREGEKREGASWTGGFFQLLKR